MAKHASDQENQVAEVEQVDRETGEVKERGRDVSGHALVVRTERPPLPTFASGAMLDVVRNLASPEALEAQTQMSLAYDNACQALLSPNDYQEEGGRQFKKKSAWRKVGRAFGISTEILHLEGRWVTEWDEHLERPFRHYLASATVRATAPWGQVMEQVGMCGTRESRFYTSGAACPNCGGPMWDNRDKNWGGDFGCKDKDGCGTVLEAGEYDVALVTGKRPNRTARGKAEHDCTSTAVTRATNRAISDLVAAGEVSAEEVEGGDERSFSRQDSGGGQGGVKPKGKAKSKPKGQAPPEFATEEQRTKLREILHAEWLPLGEREGLSKALDADGKDALRYERAVTAIRFYDGEMPKWKAEHAARLEEEGAGDIGAKEAAAIEAEEAAEGEGGTDWEEELFKDPKAQEGKSKPPQASGE